MKKQAPLVLSIPQPCSQNWDEMALAGSGRFCDHCQHIVIDITGMSDVTVRSLFQNLKIPLCIRATEQQLDRPIMPLPTSSSLYRIAVTVGLMLVSGATFAQAPLKHQTHRVVTWDSEQKNSLMDTYEIRGVVKDENGQALEGVNISLYCHNKVYAATSSAHDGTFSFKPVQPLQNKQEYEIQFVHDLYHTVRLNITSEDLVAQQVLKIDLRPDSLLQKKQFQKAATTIRIGMFAPTPPIAKERKKQKRPPVDAKGQPLPELLDLPDPYYPPKRDISQQPKNKTYTDEELRRMGY